MNNWQIKIAISILASFYIVCFSADLLPLADANQMNINEIYQAPSFNHLLGTDKLGRDILSRLIFAGRISLVIGFVGLIISLPLAAIYGGISGYFGGKIDMIMMRLAEALMSLPSFYLLIILSAMLPASLNNYQRFLLITCLISLISWAGLARIIRGQIMSIKNNEYIQAAKSLGLSHLQIIIKHLLPQISSFLIIAIAISIPGYIIGESSLSFLGLGINEPDPSWGNMLAQGKDLANIINHPWILWSPTICLFLCIYSFNTLANYFREKLA